MIALTPEWFEALVSKVNEDSAFRDGMKKWEGNVSIGVKPIPELSTKDNFYKIDATGGELKGLGYCGKSDAVEAKVCILVDYPLFKEMLAGEVTDLGPIIMSGKADVKGDLSYAMKFMKSITRLVEVMTSMGGEAPDELQGGDLDKFKSWISEMEASHD
ncbi:MAG: SCP2 sterol-binding domain-containing protein [Actinomycetota bacterium]|nr:SCP2 sterol-binding domain-containing protein [Actinomycetota bacterium]